MDSGNPRTLPNGELLMEKVIAKGRLPSVIGNAPAAPDWIGNLGRKLQFTNPFISSPMKAALIRLGIRGFNPKS
jgi:hypothetical protein